MQANLSEVNKFYGAIDKTMCLTNLGEFALHYTFDDNGNH